MGLLSAFLDAKLSITREMGKLVPKVDKKENICSHIIYYKFLSLQETDLERANNRITTQILRSTVPNEKP